MLVTDSRRDWIVLGARLAVVAVGLVMVLRFGARLW
jgi:hypothetical protein